MLIKGITLNKNTQGAELQFYLCTKLPHIKTYCSISSTYFTWYDMYNICITPWRKVHNLPNKSLLVFFWFRVETAFHRRTWTISVKDWNAMLSTYYARSNGRITEGAMLWQQEVTLYSFRNAKKRGGGCLITQSKREHTRSPIPHICAVSSWTTSKTAASTSSSDILKHTPVYVMDTQNLEGKAWPTL